MARTRFRGAQGRCHGESKRNRGRAGYKLLTLDAVHRTPNLYEIVSDRLFAAIRDAHLPPGAKIPTERELAEQFGVSRTVIREAVRHLGAKGVLDTKSGPRVTVAHIGPGGIGESIVLYLSQRGPLDPEEIHEVRRSLELQTVALAAKRASVEQLRVIHNECERLTHAVDVEEAAEADVAFHRSIAEATNNELFLGLVDSVADVMLTIRRATLRNMERRETTLCQHRVILEAMEARNPEAAVGAMSDHLDDSLATLLCALGMKRPSVGERNPG